MCCKGSGDRHAPGHKGALPGHSECTGRRCNRPFSYHLFWNALYPQRPEAGKRACVPRALSDGKHGEGEGTGRCAGIRRLSRDPGSGCHPDGAARHFQRGGLCCRPGYPSAQICADKGTDQPADDQDGAGSTGGAGLPAGISSGRASEGIRTDSLAGGSEKDSLSEGHAGTDRCQKKAFLQ